MTYVIRGNEKRKCVYGSVSSRTDVKMFMMNIVEYGTYTQQ